MAESVAFTYDGSNTVTATITGATVGVTYGMYSDTAAGGYTGDVSGVAASSTVVLNLPLTGGWLTAGFHFNVFVQNSAFGFNGDYLGTTVFTYGTSSPEFCFDAIWSFDGINAICCTYTLPVGPQYFLQFYDTGPNGSHAVFVIGGPRKTVCVVGDPSATTISGVNALNSATVNVASTAGFDPSGVIYFLGTIVTYTGRTGTSFTGCSAHSATAGGESVVIPLTGGIVAQLSKQSNFETFSTRLFTQSLANDGYLGNPTCPKMVSFADVVLPQ